jgi:stress-induced morphogen
MALRILDEPSDPESLAGELRRRIERELPGARARVACASPGHFEIDVECAAFSGEPRVRQHQMVYAAIAPMMAGEAPPVHAIDRLECRIP